MRAQPCITCKGQEMTAQAQPLDSRDWVKVWKSHVYSPSLPWIPECPLIALDLSARPDIKDLGRVLMQEGKGDGKVHWRYERVAGDWMCVLRIHMSWPVFTSFEVPFALPVTQRVLEGITRTRELYICFGPPSFDLEDESGMPAISELLSGDVINLEFDMSAQNELVGCLRLMLEHLRALSMVSMKVALLIKSSYHAL